MINPNATPRSAVPMPRRAYGLADREQSAKMTGLEQLQAMLDDEQPAPPISDSMTQWLHELAPGRTTFLGNPDVRYLNPMGLIHGGWAMTLLDSALGCAVHSTLVRGETFASIGTEAKFIRPIMSDTGQVTCTAEVQSRGRGTATASGRIEDRKGRLLATGTTTCFIRKAA
jgi:uncharacterized protein (TIGR00369 family)